MENVSLIIAIIAVLSSIGLNLAQRRQANAETIKAKADAANVITDTALSLIKPLEDRVDDQEADIKELRIENLILHNRVKELEKENKELRDFQIENLLLHKRVEELEKELKNLKQNN